MAGLIVIGVILLLIIATAFDGFFIVRTKEAAIIERMGKFVTVAHAGLHFKLPYVDRVRAKISLQIRQLDVMVETKTKDNVFVQIPVAVQYEVVQGSERQALHSVQPRAADRGLRPGQRPFFRGKHEPGRFFLFQGHYCPQRGDVPAR